MPPKRKPPSQRRSPLQEATPNKLNTSAAVENLRHNSENHSVGEISRKNRKNHSIHFKDNSTNIKFLRRVHTGRCGKIARLRRDVEVIDDHASSGTRKLAKEWPMTVQKEAVDALRQELKLRQDLWRLVSGIEITEEGCIQRPQVPYDYWNLETKEEKVNLISSFTPGALSSRAEKDRSVDTKVCCGDTVELKNGALVKIREIYPNQQGDQVLISGDLFERNMSLQGWLPSIENEVFWAWTFLNGQDPESAEPFVVEAQSSEILRKWNLRPRAFQYNSPPDERSSYGQVQDNITGQGTLICSWKYVRGIDEKIYRTQYNEKGNYDEKLLIPLAATDSIDGSHSSYKRQCYRQGLFSNPGSPRDDSQGQEHISKRENEVTDNYGLPSSKTGDRSQRADNASSSYTFGDAFAGCGGMSRAAEMAGLVVKWGFDMDAIAIEAYRMNFPNADARHREADEFVALGTDVKLQVDILHASPPCQSFSPANRGNHGNPGQEQNSASLFAIPEIMKQTDPKVVIIEQVPNIMTEYAEYFGAIVQFFTNLGWSIRWKVINCLDFGVPQTRKRLFMIGSRPGIDLPKFPVATHSEQDYETVFNTIMARRGKSTKHPKTGKRLTISELAFIQTFPPEHIFHGTDNDQVRQIGNAVSPLVGQAILEEAKRSLMRTDGIYSDDDAPDPHDPSNKLEAPCERYSSVDHSTVICDTADSVPTKAVVRPLKRKSTSSEDCLAVPKVRRTTNMTLRPL